MQWYRNDWHLTTITVVGMTKIFLNNSNARSLHSHCTHTHVQHYNMPSILLDVPTRFSARKSQDLQRCSLTGAVANTGPVVVVGAHLAKNISTHNITLCLCYLVGTYFYTVVCIVQWRRRNHRIFALCTAAGTCTQ